MHKAGIEERTTKRGIAAKQVTAICVCAAERASVCVTLSRVSHGLGSPSSQMLPPALCSVCVAVKSPQLLNRAVLVRSARQPRWKS